MKRAYYSSDINTFCRTAPEKVQGILSMAHRFDLTENQTLAWKEQIYLLQDLLSPYVGKILFEYSIPRMGRRIDVLLLIGPVIFVIEFKVGEREFEAKDLDQVTDYALDLQNFHEGSHERYIAPILVATQASHRADESPKGLPSDKLFKPLRTNAEGLIRV